MEDEGSKAQVKGKRPCVENPGSSSTTAAGRKALEHPCEDLASGSEAQVKGKRPRVENPSSASATATSDSVSDSVSDSDSDSGNHSASDFRNLNPCDPRNPAGGNKGLFKRRTTLYSDDCPYEFAKEHPNEVRYDFYLVENNEVIRKAVRSYPPMKAAASNASPEPIRKGLQPCDGVDLYETDPDYRAAVDSGANVISYGSTWMLTIK